MFPAPAAAPCPPLLPKAERWLRPCPGKRPTARGCLQPLMEKKTPVLGAPQQTPRAVEPIASSTAPGLGLNARPMGNPQGKEVSLFTTRS